jgi:hypothetical protein
MSILDEEGHPVDENDGPKPVEWVEEGPTKLSIMLGHEPHLVCSS